MAIGKRTFFQIPSQLLSLAPRYLVRKFAFRLSTATGAIITGRHGAVFLELNDARPFGDINVASGQTLWTGISFLTIRKM